MRSLRAAAEQHKAHEDDYDHFFHQDPRGIAACSSTPGWVFIREEKTFHTPSEERKITRPVMLREAEQTACWRSRTRG